MPDLGHFDALCPGFFHCQRGAFCAVEQIDAFFAVRPEDIQVAQILLEKEGIGLIFPETGLQIPV